MSRRDSPSILEDLDLNLLRVFDMLRVEGSVSGAARRLHLSQPGASRALARLREALGDPLFIPSNDGLMLTPYAERIADYVRSALELLSAGIARYDFDPTRSDRRFVIAMSSYSEAVLLPRLCRRLKVDAPGLRLETVGLQADPARAPGDRSLDLSIAVSAPEAPNIRTRSLLHDEFAAVARNDHPIFSQDLGSSAIFAELRHVALATEALLPHSVDNPIAWQTARGLVRVRLQSLLTSVLLVSSTDCVTVLPRLLATELASRSLLRIVPVRLDLVGFELRMCWHEGFHADDGHRWLRGVISDVAAELEGGGKDVVRTIDSRVSAKM